ncbi:hypothetical protein PGIN_15-9_01417 [Porphyromonas gingivalis]|nr:hypothetical protein PGIN_15-9_01417 [Porphyromonas gingivalis]
MMVLLPAALFAKAGCACGCYGPRGRCGESIAKSGTPNPFVSINDTARVFILLSAESNYLGTFAAVCRPPPQVVAAPSVSRVREEPMHLTGERRRATPGKRRDAAVAVCNIPSKKRLDVLPETSRPFARNV